MDQRFDILAVGEVNVDLILSGLPRIPLFGTEVLAGGLSQRLGGCTANFVVFCRRLGAGVAFVTRIGDDAFGRFLRDELCRYAVAADFIALEPELPTGLTVSLSGAADRAFVTYPGTIDSVWAEDVPDELLSRCRHLHVGSYFMQSRLRQGIVGLFERAKAAGLSTSLDTGYDPAERWDSGIHRLLPLVDVFLPNEIEAMQIAGVEDPAVSARKLAREAGLVAMKLGSAGALAACGDEIVRVPGFKVGAVDTTCCGDAFNAGFLTRRLAGGTLAECLQAGNAAGAIIATGVGNAAELLSPVAMAELVARNA